MDIKRVNEYGDGLYKYEIINNNEQDMPKTKTYLSNIDFLFKIFISRRNLANDDLYIRAIDRIYILSL